MTLIELLQIRSNVMEAVYTLYCIHKHNDLSISGAVFSHADALLWEML